MKTLRNDDSIAATLFRHDDFTNITEMMTLAAGFSGLRLDFYFTVIIFIIWGD